MKIKRPVSKHPIPSHANLVFKGAIFDVYQWKQTMFDGSTQTFEKLKRPDIVNVIPIVGENIILTEQLQPGWRQPLFGAPGGRLDAGEDSIEAAKRELLEETGYEAGQFVLWEAIQPMEKIDFAIYTFIAKRCRKVADAKLDAGEKITLKKLSFNGFLDIVADERYRDWEIAIKVFRILQDPSGKDQLRKLFFE